jgi:glycosyltransferase involved in cell wall biosynthesis
MYVFIINSLGFGGAESSLLRVLLIFKKRGIPFKLIVQNKIHFELDYSLFNEEIIFLQAYKRSFLAFVLNLFSIIRIKNIVSKFDRSETKNLKIIGVLPQSVILGYLLAKRIHCDMIPVEENNLELSLKGGFQNYLFKFFLKRIYKNVNSCIVISREIADQVREIFHYTGQINYIPNCIDLALGEPEPTLVTNELRFIMVGRLVEQKNYLFALEIFRELRNQGLNFCVDIYGNGPLHDSLNNKIREYQLSDNVILKGISNNILNVMKNYNFFLHTALYEGFGNVIIEAMYNKLIVISSDVDYGPREIITHNLNGFLLPLNLTYWVDFLKSIANEFDRYEYLRNNARKRSYDFGSEVIATQYIEVLKVC